MRTIKLLCCVAAVGLGATSHAAVVTRNPLDYAIGANVSTAFSGVTLTRLANASGTVGYAPMLDPAIVGRCTTYGACPIFGTVGTIGGVLWGMSEYRNCYNANRAGHSSIDCGAPWAVLQATFATPTDFVEFELTWYADPPMLLAYDAAGNEIASCLPFSTSGCLTTHTFTPGYEQIGKIRLTSSTGRIAKVVVGSFGASSRLYSMQYTHLKAPKCP